MSEFQQTLWAVATMFYSTDLNYSWQLSRSACQNTAWLSAPEKNSQFGTKNSPAIVPHLNLRSLFWIQSESHRFSTHSTVRRHQVLPEGIWQPQNPDSPKWRRWWQKGAAVRATFSSQTCQAWTVLAVLLSLGEGRIFAFDLVRNKACGGLES